MDISPTSVISSGLYSQQGLDSELRSTERLTGSTFNHNGSLIIHDFEILKSQNIRKTPAF